MRSRAWLVGAVLGFALGLILWSSGVWAPLDRRLGDELMRIRGVERDDSPFAVVLLDARTYEAWPEPTPQWGGHLAGLVDDLFRAGARDVALDFVLAPDTRADASVAETNGRLGDAILRRPERVVLGYQIGTQGGVTEPAEEFRLGGSELAFFDLPPETDGVLRMGIRQLGLGATSLAEALARRRGPTDGPETFVGDLARWRILSVSALDVSRRGVELRGKSVLIGSVGPNDEDRKRLPILGARPGVEAQARLASTLLAGTPLRPLPIAFPILAATGAVLLGLLARRPIAILVFAPLWLGVATGCMAFAFQTPWVGPVGASAFASLFSLVGQAIDERALRREIQSAFAYQIDEETFACLLANPSLRRPGDAAETTATIMFLDVRNSTALGASVPNRDFFDRLNELFSRLLPLVGEHGGVVLSFAGDGFMAVFGAFRPLENDAQAAVEAALAMVALRGTTDPAIGIGLHRGAFLLGSLGGTTRAQFSAIGDAVNLASRVESQTKEFGATVLASVAVTDRITGRSWESPLTFVPKNHPRPLTVYRVD